MSIRKAIAQKISDGGDGGWALGVLAMLFASLVATGFFVMAYQIAKELSGC